MQLKNITKHELIGKKTKIYDSTNPSQKGIEGTIIDETKNTIKIRTQNGDKIIMKKNVTIEVTQDKQIIRIKGEKITGKPEERIKRK